VKANSYSFGAFIGQRADIYIFLVATSFHELPGQLAKLINGVREIYFQDATAVKHAFIVVLDSENAKSILLAIPVTADTFEASGAVVEGMGQDSDFGFG
jgi:uncharacterized protein (DUF1015 family)